MCDVECYVKQGGAMWNEVECGLWHGMCGTLYDVECGP